LPDAMYLKKGDSLIKKTLDTKEFLLKVKSGHLECISTVLKEGAETRPFSHDGEEIKIAIEGEIDYHVADKVYRLKGGDVLWHDAKDEHRAVNVGDGVARYITVGPQLKPAGFRTIE